MIGVLMISAGVLLALIAVIGGRIKASKITKNEAYAPAFTAKRQAIIPVNTDIIEEETMLLDDGQEETTLLDDDDKTE